jgi:hypothetical protein
MIVKSVKRVAAAVAMAGAVSTGVFVGGAGTASAATNWYWWPGHQYIGTYNSPTACALAALQYEVNTGRDYTCSGSDLYLVY